MEKYDLRAIFSFSVICCALGFFGSFWTQVWQFYLSGTLEGIGVVTITYLGAPTIVNRRFNIHMGLIALIFALSLTTVYLGKSIKQTLEPSTN